jgi:hypothetical protein
LKGAPGVAEELVYELGQAWQAQDWNRAAVVGEQLATGWPQDPRVGGWWYDAALARKFLRDWPEAYRLGRHAAAHASTGGQDPAFWNLGIAATIMRDWATARAAWEGFGITLPAGDGPIDGNFGVACVRLACRESQEVVWVRRLCPTRARVVSVPFDTGRRYGEVVVHDGEPKGDRVVGERTYRVFDELELFEPSQIPTLTVTVTVADPADLQALNDLFDADGFGFEPLASGQMLCRCCSEGSVVTERAVLGGSQRCLVAAPPDAARQVLNAWQARGTRTWADLHEAT